MFASRPSLTQIKFRLRRRILPTLKERIFFLHVPKCGGSSLDRAIRDGYGYPRALQQLHCFHLNHQAACAAAAPRNNQRELIESILLYHMANPACHYISGHFAYTDAVAQARGQWQLVTVLRHPVSKWFSKYFYNRYKEHSTHFKLECSIQEYLQSEIGISDGCDYVRLFAGDRFRNDSTSAEAVQQAIENLRQFQLVGILERLETFADRFRKRFGVKLAIPHERTSPVPRSHQDNIVTKDIRKQVEELCQPDIAVYEAVLKLQP